MLPFGPPNVKKLTDKRNVKKLIKALNYQKDTHNARPSHTRLEARSVRKAAADALGQIGDARAVEPLIAVVNDEIRDVPNLVHPDDNVLARSAEEAGVPVFSVNDELQDVPNLVHPDQVLARVAEKGDSSFIFGFRQAFGIVKAIVATDEVSLNDEIQDMRSHAIDALGQIGDVGAVEPLVTVLNHRYQHVYEQARYCYVREHAIDALGQIGDPRAVEPLIAILDDENWDVRAAAARALGQIGIPAVERLITALTASNEYVRGAVAQALGQIGDVRAVEPLIATLDDENWDVRAAAVGALGQIGDPRAVESLIAALKQRDRNVRGAVAKALGQIGDVRAVEPLISDLNHRDRDVRAAAAEALDRLAWSPDEGAAGAAYWAVKGK